MASLLAKGEVLWQLLFVPIPAIQQSIDQQLQYLGLQSGQYVAAHIRALYDENQTQPTMMVQNAMNCASQLQAGVPIFVASDSHDVIQTAIQYGRSKHHAIVGRTNATAQPFHLDRGSGFLTYDTNRTHHAPSLYYDTFVDLYLMANSRCVTWSDGFYGHWGSLLSWDPTCFSRHSLQTCHWKNNDNG